MTEFRHSPSWPGGSWPGTVPPPSATWPSGPACCCGSARSGLTAISAELIQRPDGLADLAALAGQRDHGLPPPRLLGSFDPLLHGWVSREPILGQHTGIITVNGLFRPFALVEGQAVATWSLPGGVVELDWLAEVSGSAQEALAADAPTSAASSASS